MEGQVLVLRPCTEVPGEMDLILLTVTKQSPFAGAPGPVESYHGDDLDDCGAETIKTPGKAGRLQDDRRNHRKQKESLASVLYTVETWM